MSVHFFDICHMDGKQELNILPGNLCAYHYVSFLHVPLTVRSVTQAETQLIVSNFNDLPSVL